MKSKDIGEYGEKIACYFLKSKGYKILDKNYKKKWKGKLMGEIDIIAQKDSCISFVEVKTIGCDFSSFNPEDKVNFKKTEKIRKVAEIWLNENKIFFDLKWQVDIVSIKVDLIGRKAKIRHFINC